MAYNLSRMTAYALISAIEEDLRSVLKNHLGQESCSNEDFDSDLIKKAKNRLEKDIGSSIGEYLISDVVEYFDLGDSYQTINKNNKYFPSPFVQSIKNHTVSFQKIVPVRNRVMHIRPLNFDDLPLVIDFCKSLCSESNEIWSNINATFNKLDCEPTFVLNLDIKNYDHIDTISHNLPLPDFDETGLIGRDKQVKQILDLCHGAFPVISIVGEGGVGKSALALKVAYELIEDKRSRFDAVIWVTSKTSQITHNEIVEIKGAISSSIAILEEISNQLGASNSNSDVFEELREYLATFRIALFIDNLETILDQNIKNFISGLPEGSKVIITSRIGLGAYDFPVKLQGIEEGYASQLLRTLARLRGIDNLAALPETMLKNYCNRLHRNPGFIKWFVAAIQTGAQPESALQSSLFLDFCMSNVYGYLSNDTKLLVQTFQCAPGWKDIAELAYLSDFDAFQVQKSLQELMATNMLAENLKQLGTTVKTTYQLSELARAFLNKTHKPKKFISEKIAGNRNKLNALIEKQASTLNKNRYSLKYIKIRTKADQLIAIKLDECIKYVLGDAVDKAYVILEELKVLAPDYFEVHRVFAMLHQKNGNHPDASGCYELAIQLAPDMPQLYYYYGRFLLSDAQQIPDALAKFETAYLLDKDSLEIAVDFARAHMFLHQFSECNAILEKYASLDFSEQTQVHRTYLDTVVQVEYRTADNYCIQGEYLLCIQHLKRMREKYEKIKYLLNDLHIRKKLEKLDKPCKCYKKTKDMITLFL